MTDPAGSRVVLRPIASPLPVGFLALVLATVPFAAAQLGWVPPTDGRIAALAAVAATVPLQLLASGIGFLARDVAAATGMGVLAGTWGTVGLATLTSPPGATSKGLGVFLLTAGLCMFAPAAAARAKRGLGGPAAGSGRVVRGSRPRAGGRPGPHGAPARTTAAGFRRARRPLPPVIQARAGKETPTPPRVCAP